MSDSPIARTTVTNVAPGTVDGQTLIWDGGVPQWQPTDDLMVVGGNVGIGTDTPTRKLHVVDVGPNNALIASTTNTASYLRFKAVGTGATANEPTIGAVDDLNLAFRTQVGEAMRIDSTGNVGIGTTNPQSFTDKFLVIKAASGASVKLCSTAVGEAPGDGFDLTISGTDTYLVNRENGFMQFGTNDIERMRIDASGNLLVGTTVAPASGNGGIQLGAPISGNRGIFQQGKQTGVTGLERIQQYYYGTSEVGHIDISSTATAYVTNSDYRLKENEVPLTGALDRVGQLLPYRFSFKADPDKTVDGFFAHEVSPVVPNAVSGEKDGEEMQGIDQSKLVPLLTAAIQELTARVEALEA